MAQAAASVTYQSHPQEMSQTTPTGHVQGEAETGYLRNDISTFQRAGSNVWKRCQLMLADAPLGVIVACSGRVYARTQIV
jgi:hypothetical protein